MNRRRSQMYFAPMRFLQNSSLYSLVPMKNRTHLPDEGFGPMSLTLAHYRGVPLNFMVSCLAKDQVPGGARIGKSRVFVHCPCDRLIPFGRMQQHYGGPRCRKDLVK